MNVFIAIVITGIGTYLMRGGFILLLAQRQFPPLALRTLAYVSPAGQFSTSVVVVSWPPTCVPVTTTGDNPARAA